VTSIQGLGFGGRAYPVYDSPGSWCWPRPERPEIPGHLASSHAITYLSS